MFIEEWMVFSTDEVKHKTIIFALLNIKLFYFPPWTYVILISCIYTCTARNLFQAYCVSIYYELICNNAVMTSEWNWLEEISFFCFFAWSVYGSMFSPHPSNHFSIHPSSKPLCQHTCIHTLGQIKVSHTHLAGPFLNIYQICIHPQVKKTLVVCVWVPCSVETPVGSCFQDIKPSYGYLHLHS